MNIWTIIAVVFSGLFMLISALNMGLQNKPLAVFLFLAALCCDIYLVFFVSLPNEWIRYMFLFIFLFQMFCFIAVLFARPQKKNSYRRIR